MSIFSTKDRADMTHIVVEENGSTLYIFEATMDDQGIIFKHFTHEILHVVN